MTRKPYDPIVVAEQQARLARRRDVFGRASDAAEALLWFDEYAWGRAGALEFAATATASATPRANYAKPYLQRAAKQFVDQVLLKAIELAQADLREATTEDRAGRADCPQGDK